MNLFKTTKEHEEYWKNRKIDWKKSYLDTWNHPHRNIISEILGLFPWLSLLELGCGSGPNLVNIIKKYPGKQIGGTDINEDAIELARKIFKGGIFKVGSAEDVMLSDDSVDIILTDMMLIYVGWWKIDKYIEEIKRLARNKIILCEFHHTSFWQRLRLKLTSGYNAYNYIKLLQKHGFYDIYISKIPENAWPGGDPQKTFGYIMWANVPKK